MFHPLRDPQLQFKSENKNMEDIIKYNIKKKINKNPSHSLFLNKLRTIFVQFKT